MFTPQLLDDIRVMRQRAALRASGESRNRTIARETAAMNGQVMTFRSGGKRVAERWAKTDRWNKDGSPGIAGMSGNVHVCRNLKTAKLKRYVAPAWKPDLPPQAMCLEAYLTKMGKLKYRKREIGTGAYDPCVRFAIAAEGIRKDASTGERLSRVVRLGGRLVQVAV
jgi:hypothetical protein